MKTYKNILKTEKEILKEGFQLKNEMIKSFDINVIGHFGNSVMLEMCLNSGLRLFCNYSVGNCMRYLIDIIFSVLDLTDENGIRISQIRDVPIRIIYHESSVVGFGHFLRDKFVYIDDVVALITANMKGEINRNENR